MLIMKNTDFMVTVIIIRVSEEKNRRDLLSYCPIQDGQQRYSKYIKTLEQAPSAIK